MRESFSLEQHGNSIELGVAIASLVLAVALASACSHRDCLRIADLSFRRVPVPSYPSEFPAGDQTIAVIGDVQRTSQPECFIGREVNDDEQKKLLADLADSEPAAVVLLGDMVFQGDDARHWAYFDSLLAPLSKQGASFFPVLGNHEYQCLGKADLSQVRRRFPTFSEGLTYYAFDWGEIRMIVLDANRDKLCEGVHGRDARCSAAWKRQLDWLEKELRTEKRGALVFVHQSPFTQSPIVDKDRAEPLEFVPAFLESKHALAMLSAHAHGYERWDFGKPFVVTAGGGGPRPPRRRPGSPADRCNLGWPRPFNYLLLTQDSTGVHVVVRGLHKGEEEVREFECERQSWTFNDAEAAVAEARP